MIRRDDSLPRKRLRIRGDKDVRHRKRTKLLEKCDYRCVYCGVHNDDSRLTVDHIIAACNGGTNQMSNMQMLCAPCNRDKGAVEDPKTKELEKAYYRARIAKRIKERGLVKPL